LGAISGENKTLKESAVAVGVLFTKEFCMLKMTKKQTKKFAY